ncbi:MAG: type II secretion system protein [Bdellovibrionaceae bacterium]|nr:type II secretion system protein [Pseudobdellovibrionaceae bacterium]
MKNSNLKSQSGFSIVETIVAAAIGIIVISGLITGAYYIRKMSSTVQIRSTEEKQIAQVIENIRSSIETYQITYNDDDATPEDTREAALKIENLPMAWSADVITTAQECKNCPGRFGFVIQPFERMRGLYLVTLRLTHIEWSEGSKDYQFVVSVR